jgi:lactoylglutathione lyase
VFSSHTWRGSRQGGDGRIRRRPGQASQPSLVSENVEEDFKRAVEAGAEPLQEPEKTPWGQVSSYLRLPDGTFVDIASPVAY